MYFSGSRTIIITVNIMREMGADLFSEGGRLLDIPAYEIG